MSLRQEFDSQFRYFAEQSGKYWQLRQVAEELDLLDLEAYIYFGTGKWSNLTNTYSGPYIELEPKHIPGLGWDLDTGLRLTDTTPTLADAAKVLLPKVGRFEKGYDEVSNKLTLTANYKGVAIILKDTPPETCTVVKEEVEEEVPASEAYTRTVTKYRLVGDCEPLLAG